MVESTVGGSIRGGIGERARSLENLRDAAVERALDGRRENAEAIVEMTMAAGRALIERDGVLDFNMRELLALAGVSNRAFYRHFETKEGLVAALAAEVYDRLVSELARAARGPGSPAEVVHAWVDAALAFADDPALAARGRVFVAYEIRLRELVPDLFAEIGRTLVADLGAVLRAGQADGSFSEDAGIWEVRLAVRLVVATLQHHTFERTVPAPDERAALVNAIIASWT